MTVFVWDYLHGYVLYHIKKSSHVHSGNNSGAPARGAS